MPVKTLGSRSASFALIAFLFDVCKSVVLQQLATVSISPDHSDLGFITNFLWSHYLQRRLHVYANDPK